MADQPTALDQLADFLTGTSVGFLSVALGMSDGHPLTKTAQRFFALRAALGVHGYASKEEALPAIRATLGVTAPPAAGLPAEGENGGDTKGVKRGL